MCLAVKWALNPYATATFVYVLFFFLTEHLFMFNIQVKCSCLLNNPVDPIIHLSHANCN